MKILQLIQKLRKTALIDPSPYKKTSLRSQSLTGPSNRLICIGLRKRKTGFIPGISWQLFTGPDE